jgi:hypothetical protein
MKITRARLELKVEDLWIGIFWKHGYANFDEGPKRMWTDIWICLVPCVPLHVTILYKVAICLNGKSGGKIEAVK